VEVGAQHHMPEGGSTELSQAEASRKGLKAGMGEVG
jgi:hypothetical protein